MFDPKMDCYHDEETFTLALEEKNFNLEICMLAIFLVSK